MQALEELDYLAALDNDGNLSEMGIIMSEFPLEPQMAKTVLASCEFDCVSEVVIIAAMLTGNKAFPQNLHKMYMCTTNQFWSKDYVLSCILWIVPQLLLASWFPLWN